MKSEPFNPSPAEKRIEEMRKRGECVTSPHFAGPHSTTAVVPVLTEAYIQNQESGNTETQVKNN